MLPSGSSKLSSTLCYLANRLGTAESVRDWEGRAGGAATIWGEKQLRGVRYAVEESREFPDLWYHESNEDCGNSRLIHQGTGVHMQSTYSPQKSLIHNLILGL